MPQAIEIVRQSSRASVSLLQRKLRVGYSRAARLIQLLEEQGIVGPDEGPTKGRVVLARADAPPPKVEQLPRRAQSNARTARAFQEEDGFADWTEKDWEDLDKD